MMINKNNVSSSKERQWLSEYAAKMKKLVGYGPRHYYIQQMTITGRDNAAVAASKWRHLANEYRFQFRWRRSCPS